MNPGARRGIQIDMELPHTNPVGIAVTPEAFSEKPRRYSSTVRLAAGLLLGAFLAVVSVTTALSLGAYCLTSDTENTANLPHGYVPGAR